MGKNLIYGKIDKLIQTRILLNYKYNQMRDDNYMCFNCEHSNRVGIGYMIEYRCKICNDKLSEIVDTYFNEREKMIECPLLSNKEE